MNNRKICPVCKGVNLFEFLKPKDYFLTNESFSLARCEECGLLITNPFPNQESSNKYYNSAEYLSHSNEKNSLFSLLYQTVKKYNTINKYNVSTRNIIKRNVLDIGCGIGDFLSHCKSKGWNVVGLEPNEKARSAAQISLGDNIFDVTEIDKLDSHSFDLITLWHVLEHIHDLDNQMIHLRRLLSKDGQIVVALPNYESYDARIYKEYWAAYDVPRHLYHFNRSSINKLFVSYGFECIEQTNMYWDAYYVSLLSEKYLGKTGLVKYLRAIYRASLSNLLAVTNNKSSSTIYIFKEINSTQK